VLTRELISRIVSSGPLPARNGSGCSIRRSMWSCGGASAGAVAVVSSGPGTVRACERPPVAQTATSARSRPRRAIAFTRRIIRDEREQQQQLLLRQSGALCPQTEVAPRATGCGGGNRSEEHTSELQSRENLVCRLLLEKK